jgi:hypothetical protein
MSANATYRRIEPTEDPQAVLDDLRDRKAVLDDLRSRKDTIDELKGVLEDLINAKATAKILGWHIATVYRACRNGSGPKKRRLRFVMRGRETCTTRAWIAEFLEGLTRDRLEATGAPAPAAPRSPARRRRAMAKARQELEIMKF